MVRGQGQGKIRVGLGLGLMVGFGLLSDRAQATTPMATVEAIAPAPLHQPKASSISWSDQKRDLFQTPASQSSPSATASTVGPIQTALNLDPHVAAIPHSAALSTIDSRPARPTQTRTSAGAEVPPTVTGWSISEALPEPHPSVAASESTSAIDLADGSWPSSSEIGTEVDIDPAIIENSPVLRRWLEAIPDVAADIKYDPAFRPRLRAGYAFFPSNSQTSGFQVGVQDWFIGRTPLTLSADYSQNGRGDRASYGIDAQYYILPLGWYGNVAPVLGYRSLDTPTYSVSGFNVGFRIVLIPSRTGAADLSLSQTWVAPGTPDEVGLTTFSVGYAVTSQLRIATDIQTQNAPGRQDSRVGVLLEWLL